MEHLNPLDVFNPRDIVFNQLREGWASDKEARSKREIKSWHLSGFGTCLCGRYLARSGAEPDQELDGRVLSVFDIGNKEEAWIMEFLKKHPGATIEQQVRIENKDLNISGYADGVVSIADRKIGLEIKSKHSRAFWYMTKDGAPQHNRMQLWLALNELKLESGLLVYISKDDREIMSFPVYLDDQELMVATMSEVNMLNLAWRTKIPPPPAENGTWQAKYCNYHKQCLKIKKSGEYLTGPGKPQVTTPEDMPKEIKESIITEIKE